MEWCGKAVSLIHKIGIMLKSMSLSLQVDTGRFKESDCADGLFCFEGLLFFYFGGGGAPSCHQLLPNCEWRGMSAKWKKMIMGRRDDDSKKIKKKFEKFVVSLS